MADKYDAKLTQAEDHLARMREAEHEADQRPFHHELSAFMAATRSVSLYVFEELKRQLTNKAAKKKFCGLTKKRPAMEYLRLTRNEDTHAVPFHATAAVSGPVTVKGKLDPNPLPLADGRTRAPIITFVGPVHRWEFPAWKGSGSPEVFAACGEILREVRKFLVDAEAAGVISRC